MSYTENDITYIGNESETYTLLFKGQSVAELMLGEDGVIEMIGVIKNVLFPYIDDDDVTIIIKNDGDGLGVIVDVYETADDGDWLDGITLWFDDFSN